MAITRACIICNGEPASSELLRECIKRCDIIIAADGGIDQLSRIGIAPHFLVGDLDSIAEESMSDAGETEIIRYPQDKNESDSELAIIEALGRGAEAVTLLSATGKRLDHSFSNLSVLTRYAGRAFLFDGKFSVFSLDADISEAKLNMAQGRTLSLFAFGKNVSGVTVTGTKWELDNATVQAGSLGLSNESTGTVVTISSKTGTLLVFAECRPDDIEVTHRRVE